MRRRSASSSHRSHVCATPGPTQLLLCSLAKQTNMLQTCVHVELYDICYFMAGFFYSNTFKVCSKHSSMYSMYIYFQSDTTVHFKNAPCLYKRSSNSYFGDPINNASMNNHSNDLCGHMFYYIQI